jgi:hypothetical protein
MSHLQNHAIFRPTVNKGFQQHFLEDKWITQIFLAELGIPVARTYSLFHPEFGCSLSGAPMVDAAHVTKLIDREIPLRLVFKPRGGRKGQHIIIADVAKRDDEATEVCSSVGTMLLDQFLSELPQDAFNDYNRCYHGWLVQEYIQQHPFLSTINPNTITSVRVVTFIDSSDDVHVHLAALRLGRKGNAADNWDKGVFPCLSTLVMVN